MVLRYKLDWCRLCSHVYVWGVILKPQPVRVLVWNTLIAHIPKIRVGSTYRESVCHLSAHVTAAPPEILGCGSIMCDIWVSLVFCFLPFSAFISFLPHSTELKGDDKIVISGESVHRAPFFIFHKLPFVALKNLLHGYHTFPPICFLVFICWLHCTTVKEFFSWLELLYFSEHYEAPTIVSRMGCLETQMYAVAMVKVELLSSHL